jgi:hypothetical protein
VGFQERDLAMPNEINGFVIISLNRNVCVRLPAFASFARAMELEMELGEECRFAEARPEPQSCIIGFPRV